MISAISIKNFQAHKWLRLRFDAGITTIVGPSDMGKSAIIRALRWALTNRPGGDAFVRHGSQHAATVRVKIDGRTITRRRGGVSTQNEYHLDAKEYKAFGRTVPADIEALVNMGDTGWQNQHDAPYWFCETPGEVSRRLNAIVDLGIIDDTMAAVAKQVHRTRTKLEISEADLTAAKLELDALAWVPKFDAAVTVVEEAANAHTTTTTRATTAHDLINTAYNHRDAHEDAAVAAQAGLAMGDAWLVARVARDTETNLGALVNAAQSLGDDVGPVPPTDAMEKTKDAAVLAALTAGVLRGLIDMVNEKEDALCHAETKLITAEKMMPKTCPMCGAFS